MKVARQKWGFRDWTERKTYVLWVDRYTCRECERHGDALQAHEFLTVDHIIARADGGSDDLNNLQTLCSTCHQIKDGWVPKKAEILELTKAWIVG